MKPDIEQLPDAQLSAIFAREVAGWAGDFVYWKDAEGKEVTDDEEYPIAPFFATSADAVMPFVEKVACSPHRRRLPDAWLFFVALQDGTYVKAEATTFARAACIALIKAKRAEKERAP